MLSLSRKADYGLVALAGLAARSDTASARELSDSLHLPLPALRNILKRLTGHGILISTQGPQGGYRLARRPDKITLGQLVEAIDGPVRLVRCCPGPAGEDEPRCQLEDSCRIKGAVQQVHRDLIDYLDRLTLAHIVSASVPPAPGLSFGAARSQAGAGVTRSVITTPTATTLAKRELHLE